MMQVGNLSCVKDLDHQAGVDYMFRYIRGSFGVRTAYCFIARQSLMALGSLISYVFEVYVYVLRCWLIASAV